MELTFGNVLLTYILVMIIVGLMFAILMGEDIEEKFIAFLGGAWTGFCLTTAGWIVYVAVHFIQKFW